MCGGGGFNQRQAQRRGELAALARGAMAVLDPFLFIHIK